MPNLIVFALVSVDRYSGDYTKSVTKFTQHGLSTFELSLNSDLINGYPLENIGTDSVQFYHRFLKNTRRLDNPFCPTQLTHAQFDNTNFLIVHNFDNGEEAEGQLTAKLKFASTLSKKLMLLYMPVFDKRLYFDNHFNVVKQ